MRLAAAADLHCTPARAAEVRAELGGVAVFNVARPVLLAGTPPRAYRVFEV